MHDDNIRRGANGFTFTHNTRETNLARRDIRHMEVSDSLAWIMFGFLPMLGSMELAWRLSGIRKSKKAKIGLVPVHDMLQK